MAITVAGSFPQLSGTFVPNAVWSGKLLVKFYDSTVFGEIANTDYEGEIKKMGDKLNIRTTPNMVINDYEKGQNLDTDTPESPNVELTIDKAKYWNFLVDDIDKFQSDLDFVEDWTMDASEQLKIAIDTNLLATVYSQADDDNQGATAGRISNDIDLGVATAAGAKQITKANVLEFIVDMGTVLDEQNVPENDRYLVLPAWVCGMIKKSDLKDASLAGDATSVMRNGRLGMIDRFTIYKSNLIARTVDSGTTIFNIIAGQRHAISFASQFTENEVIKSELTFGHKARGLQVYGYKVLKPEALVYGAIKR